jgi:hypothetical protein
MSLDSGDLGEAALEQLTGYGINGYTRTRQWNLEVNHKHTAMAFIGEQTVI